MSRPVAVVADRGITSYGTAPFDPPISLPELDHVGWLRTEPGDNDPYLLVRDALRLLGFDGGRYGSNTWNPLGGLIKQGGHVVVKPNLVLHPPTSSHSIEAIVTHAAVLRAVVDYVLLATGPQGRVTICDVPLQEADFALLTHLNGSAALLEHYQRRGLDVRLLDFRRERARVDDAGFVAERTPLAGDPRGYVAVDLGAESALESISQDHQRFTVTNYDQFGSTKHHVPGRHEYLISRTVLEADAVINVPKLKTHQKTGLTASLKNLIGINGDKSWLPHYRAGSPASGGDEYPDGNRAVGWSVAARQRLQGRSALAWKGARAAWQLYKRHVLHLPPGAKLSNADGGWPTDGAWWGNDTLWRTICDLNEALLRADATGKLGEPRRPYLSIVDAIVAGEGNGPLYATPRPLGAIVAGQDPVATDIVCSELLGYDWQRIPMLEAIVRQAPTFTDVRPERPEVDRWLVGDAADILATAAQHPFRAPLGWRAVFNRPADEPLLQTVA